MISIEFTGTVKRAGHEPVSIPVQVILSYDVANDPFAVQAAFGTDGDEGVVWTFSRSLLAVGATALFPYGQGDVKFRYWPEADIVVMCLTSPEGHADIALPCEPVNTFIADTRPLIDQVDEREVEALVDGLLEEVFGK